MVSTRKRLMSPLLIHIERTGPMVNLQEAIRYIHNRSDDQQRRLYMRMSRSKPLSTHERRSVYQFLLIGYMAFVLLVNGRYGWLFSTLFEKRQQLMARRLLDTGKADIKEIVETFEDEEMLRSSGLDNLWCFNSLVEGGSDTEEAGDPQSSM